MAKIDIPSFFGLKGGGEGNFDTSQILLDLIHNSLFNSNLFSVNLSWNEKKELLEAYGYIYLDITLHDGGEYTIALPSSLNKEEIKKISQGINTQEEAYEFNVDVVLRRKNRELYLSILKYLIEKFL